ncbi:unnamed protein product, partial [Ectocarpus sp. 6 AP-2014]
ADELGVGHAQPNEGGVERGGEHERQLLLLRAGREALDVRDELLDGDLPLLRRRAGLPLLGRVAEEGLAHGRHGHLSRSRRPAGVVPAALRLPFIVIIVRVIVQVFHAVA